jgi:signal transduction histidine kinase
MAETPLSQSDEQTAFIAQHVCFAVSDTGIGIAPQLHGALFEDFSQVDSALQKPLRGTGLGLSLCKHFAGLPGGEVGVQSMPGTGSTFFVIFAQAIAMEPADEA